MTTGGERMKRMHSVGAVGTGSRKLASFEAALNNGRSGGSQHSSRPASAGALRTVHDGRRPLDSGLEIRSEPVTSWSSRKPRRSTSKISTSLPLSWLRGVPARIDTGLRPVAVPARKVEAARVELESDSPPVRQASKKQVTLLPQVDGLEPDSRKGSKASSIVSNSAGGSGEPSASRIALVARLYRLEAHEVSRILKAFGQAKTEENGGLSKEQFSRVLCQIFDVPALDSDLLQDAYNETEMEAEVDVSKFMSWYVKNMFTICAQLTAAPDRLASESLVDSVASKHGIAPAVMDKIKRVFDHFDVNGSGQIEFEEFRSILRSIFHARPRDDMCEKRLGRFWKEVDKNDKGKVDFSDFVSWYLRYFDPDGMAGGFCTFGPVENFYELFSAQAGWREMQRQQRVGASYGPAVMGRVNSMPLGPVAIASVA